MDDSYGCDTYGIPRVTASSDSFSDVRDSLCDDDVIGFLKAKGIRVWGHQLELDGGSSFKCQKCAMKEEVPEIIRMSSDFRQVLYKMYLLGKFKHTDCQTDDTWTEPVDRTTFTKTTNNHKPDFGGGAYSNSNSHQLNTSKRISTNSAVEDATEKHMIDGHSIRGDRDNYVYIGHGVWESGGGKCLSTMSMVKTDPKVVDDLPRGVYEALPKAMRKMCTRGSNPYSNANLTSYKSSPSSYKSDSTGLKSDTADDSGSDSPSSFASAREKLVSKLCKEKGLK